MALDATRITKAALLAATVAAVTGCAHKPPPPAGTAFTPGGPPRGAYPPPGSQPGTAPLGGVEDRGLGESGAPGSVRDFTISAGDRVYFDFDQYALRADGVAVLDRQAQWLARYPRVAVRIDGNCDERGTREYNLALGARRAEAVKTYLVAHGVDPARISTISYGKERPIDPGSSDEAAAHNRNAHTTVTAGAIGGVPDRPF